jgi:hypothetical protein
MPETRDGARIDQISAKIEVQPIAGALGAEAGDLTAYS